MKNNRMILGCVWALSLGLASSAVAQTTSHGWRTKRPAIRSSSGMRNPPRRSSRPAMSARFAESRLRPAPRRRSFRSRRPAPPVIVGKRAILGRCPKPPRGRCRGVRFPSTALRQNMRPVNRPYTPPATPPSAKMPGTTPVAATTDAAAVMAAVAAAVAIGGSVAGVELGDRHRCLVRPAAFQRADRLHPPDRTDYGSQTDDFILTDRAVSYGYDYETSFRMYAAYRFVIAAAEVRLTYSRLDSNDRLRNYRPRTPRRPFSKSSRSPATRSRPPATSPETFSTSIAPAAFGWVTTIVAATGARVGLAMVDGARLADWEYSKDVFTNVVSDGRIDVDMDFIGGGPKVGLEGRRYFGGCNQFDVYSTLDIALVLGWFKHDLQRTIPPFGVDPETVELLQSRVTRLVPVTEIEFGASWEVAPRWTISAGWFFAAWWDLGMGETQTSTIFGGNGPHFMLDDSNIMSWDGLTARIEFTW